VATDVEAATSSHIEKMIKELVQTEGVEVPATTTTTTREPSSQSSLSKDLPSLDPQLDKRIKILYILSFSSLLLTLML